jgi:N-acetylglutamate synthase-like GNAT family acetyltransferase
MTFTLRTANTDDVDQIGKLIAESVRGLAKGIYDDRQIELSIRSVFGVDHQLIADGTYFIAESDGKVVGCGGWSKRKTLYGSSVYDDSRDPQLLDPGIDAAKIRAFFIHPKAARQGIGRAILEMCESEAKAGGFRIAEMMATLPGVPLYAASGYEERERVGVPVGEGIEIDCIRMRKELI